MISVRGLYHGIRAYIEKKSIEHIINFYDASVNLNGKFEGYHFKRGIVEAQLTMPIAKYDRFGMATSRRVSKDIGAITAEAILHFREVILDYIGIDARIDDICLFDFDPSHAIQKSISGGWHDDNCGHRIKMYICLKGDGRTPTVLVPGSHRRKYRFRIEEIYRFMDKIDISKKNDEVSLRYCGGDVAIFDTNSIHRGTYEEPASQRTVIVVEFINRRKSNKISGRAPCGPGSSPSGVVEFEIDAYQELLRTQMLDPDLLRLDGDMYTYSITNLKTRA